MDRRTPEGPEIRIPSQSTDNPLEPNTGQCGDGTVGFDWFGDGS